MPAFFPKLDGGSVVALDVDSLYAAGDGLREDAGRKRRVQLDVFVTEEKVLAALFHFEIARRRFDRYTCIERISDL